MQFQYKGKYELFKKWSTHCNKIVVKPSAVVMDFYFMYFFYFSNNINFYELLPA
jgi:hypothetical protein